MPSSQTIKRTGNQFSVKADLNLLVQGFVYFDLLNGQIVLVIVIALAFERWQGDVIDGRTWASTIANLSSERSDGGLKGLIIIFPFVWQFFILIRGLRNKFLQTIMQKNMQMNHIVPDVNKLLFTVAAGYQHGWGGI